MNLLIQGSTTQDDDDRTDTSKPHNRRSTIDETGLKESSQHQEASRKARETGSERNSLLLQSSAPHDDDHTDTNIPHNRRSTIAKIGLKESIIPIESKQEIGHRHKRHRASIPALMAPHYYLR